MSPMSDAPTVPIGSLRAHAPSVPTEPVTLLPCPFCDGQATAADLGGTMTGVRCGGCGATGTEFSRARWRDSKEAERQAIAAWNTRPMIAATQQATGEGVALADKLEAIVNLGWAKGDDAIIREAARTLRALSTQQAVSPPEGVWRPIETAPRDRRWIVALVANATDRWEHLNGRAFVIRREGGTGDGYDLSWSLYPGVGGVPDHWLSCWTPLPPAPDAIGEEKGAES